MSCRAGSRQRLLPPLAQPGPYRPIGLLTTMFVHQRREYLLTQLIGLVPVRGTPRRGRYGTDQGAVDIEGRGRHGELEPKIAVAGVTALQREEAEFADREAEILELFDIESDAGGDGGSDEAGQHDEIAPGGKRQQHPITVPQGRAPRELRFFDHGATTSDSVSTMGKTLTNPVISKIFLIRASVTTTWSSPPELATAFEAAHEDTQGGRVEKGDAEEVEHDRGVALRDHLMEGLAQLRSRGNVDLTDDDDDREASIDPLLNVKLLFHHTPVLVLDGSDAAHQRVRCNSD